jgi:Spy/CpxP family protein refolding chaperone
MKNSKYKAGFMIAVILLIIFTAKAAFLQDFNRSGRPGSHGELTGEVNIKEIGGVLSLNDDQKKQLQQIIKDHREKSRLELLDKVTPILDTKQTKILEGIKADLDNKKMPRSVIEHRVERLEARLDLTTGQKEQLIKAFSDFGDKILIIKEKYTVRSEMREEIKLHFEQLHTDLEAILSPEQMKKMQKMKRQRRENFGRKLGYRDRQGMHQKAFEQLNLSTEQEEKIKEIIENSRNDMKEEMQNLDSREERQALSRAHREQVASEIRAVLTEDQKEKFDELKSEFDSRKRGRGRNWQ